MRHFLKTWSRIDSNFASVVEVGRFSKERRRGLRVSDMIAQLPDSSLIALDAKSLRSSNECYVACASRTRRMRRAAQTIFSKGRNQVVAALMVTSDVSA